MLKEAVRSDGCLCYVADGDEWVTKEVWSREEWASRRARCPHHGVAVRAAHAADGMCDAMVINESSPFEYLCANRSAGVVRWAGEAHRLCGTHLRSFLQRGKPQPIWRWRRC